MNYVPSVPQVSSIVIQPQASRDRLLRLEQVKDVVGLGKTLIYRLIQSGEFPAPYKPGGSAARWSENEIVEWLAICASQRLQ